MARPLRAVPVSPECLKSSTNEEFALRTSSNVSFGKVITSPMITAEIYARYSAI
jgi:hypothetical protein